MQQELQQAILLAQSGQRDEARALLHDFVARYPDVEAAWLWLATVAETQDERVAALYTVLRLNPANPQARSALQKLGQPLPQDSSIWSMFERPLSPLEGGLVIVAIVLAVALAVYVGSRAVGSVFPDPTATPTPTFTPIPTSTPTVTFTPTITNTPGPSPTPIIQPTLPPTWTVVPTDTLAPTRTPAPTITPVPTRTLRPTATPLITHTRVPSDTPSPTEESFEEVTEEPEAVPLEAEITQEPTEEATEES